MRRTQGRRATAKGQRRTRTDRKAARRNGGQRVEQSGPESVERAALEYARALPTLLRKAIKRQARGKPSPLLRSAPRLIRESLQLLDVHEERRERRPRTHPQLGLLTDQEQTLCRNLLELHRGQREGQPPAEAPPRLPQPLSREEIRAADPYEPPPKPAPWNGQERRHVDMSRAFLGKAERRQQRGAPSNSPEARKRRLEAALRTKLAD